jgi:pyruvate/2-oxoglutarate dehydrogenase complex dihydrolipoamide acyltransferase (E2) component
MALKAGTDNKRNVIIAGVLFCVMAYLAYTQLFSGPSTPPPAPAVNRQTTAAPQPTPASTAAAPVPANTAQARKLPVAAPGLGIDPSLHLEKLALSESIEYAGTGRNIFSADSAPIQIEDVAASARPETVQPVYTPPPAPTAPPIDLHYFGYSSDKDGKREAFLLHGEDIFEAAAGEIVNHRYKVVAVDAHSVQVTDLSYNNTQTLPLTGN